MNRPFAENEADAELRAKNLKTVEAYMELRGPDRGPKRLELWSTEEAVFELPFAENCSPVRLVGRSALVEKETGFNANMNPSWGFYDAEIYQTNDPNYFIVECIGYGDFLPDDPENSFLACFEDGSAPMLPVLDGPAYYKNHYLVEFVLKDGKIIVEREVHNPCNLVAAYHGPIPQCAWYNR